MKKTIKGVILLIFMASTLLAISQDYNKWSIEPEFGFTKIRDITPIESFNLDLGVRYMPNTLFGVKLNANYTTLDNTPIDYYSGGLHGVVNVGRLLQFESFTKHYTILTGIGGTYTYSEGVINSAVLHRISNFHLSAFVDNEIKLSNNIFARVGLDIITGVNSRPFINYTSTETTTILNFNMGLAIALSNKQEHADWYIKESLVEKIYLKPLVIDKTITNNITNEYNCDDSEYVFFKHDSFNIDQDGLYSISKIATILDNNQDKIVYLNGFASPPASDSYNIILANKRCESVKSKLISLGISENRIIINTIGEIDTIDSNNVDLSRKVFLQLK